MAEKSLNKEEFNQKLAEAFDHLRQGRHRLALTSAKKLYEANHNDFRAALCLAWAYLENGNAASALEYSDLSVRLGKGRIQTRIYRGFILMRLGIFEGAITDIDFVLSANKESISWAHHLKAKCLAGLQKYSEALEEFEKAIETDDGSNPNLQKLRGWFRTAAGFKSTFITKLVSKEQSLLEEGNEAYKLKEYWYSLWVAQKILNDPEQKEFHQDAQLLELETMYALFQIKPALLKAESIRNQFKGNQRFEHIYGKLVNRDKDNSAGRDTIEQPAAQKEMPVKKVITLSKRTDFVRFITPNVNCIYAQTFDVMDAMNTGKRNYILQFSESSTSYIGVEIIILNPEYGIKNVTLSGEAVWYLNEKEVGRNDFVVNCDSSWRSVQFFESWGTEEPGFWKRGQGRVEIYFYDEKVCERWFIIGASEIYNYEVFDLEEAENQLIQTLYSVQPQKSDTPQLSKGVQVANLKTEKETSGEKTAEGEKSIESLLANLDTFIGLGSVKQAMRDFVDYLNFIKERKRLGLKTQEGLSINSVFLGNPGTGKTTIARLLGDIFKAMGLLEKGHIVEVDRSALVGQYVGETAQKTEAVITEAMGGLLFIDEAYTLVKKGGGGQDFGQEAIDTLLKRMEDKKGEFAVIAAGYPDEMQSFLEANPGMKSRFTHTFNFEDYTPEEMIEIFKKMAKSEDYIIHPDAIELLKKEFTNLYRKRDKTFGNARLVRNFFDDAKMALSKRYLKLPENLRDKTALTTIREEDIAEILKGEATKTFKVGIDEDSLKPALDKLNSLTGLSSVKKEVNEMVKLARYYLERGEDIQSKFSDHVVFTGNPGTGKTTVARILSQIYASLGILPKGHLIEADRQALVASFVGKTAEKTTELINQSIGGTLFIDEAYTLVKAGDNSGQDFGKEAIDTLLKRMEDDRGKFIVIAAGYTDDMKTFLDSNVGLQSRFTKFINFEDYNPDELIVISENLLKEKKLKLNDEAKTLLKTYFNELYRTRDKTFGNARLVRNTVGALIKAQVLRIVDVPQEELTEDQTQFITGQDVKNALGKKQEKKVTKIVGNQELLEKHLEELNRLTGLDSVKKSVEKLISGLKVAKLREERGLKVISKNLHAVFVGNPGTGKTTVARLISKIYKELGLLEKGHLVEVDRSALVAGYQGQTAKKTDAVIEQALGGTLFIDEAYTLSRGANDFGQEAIDTILKRMEDYRDKLVVIVAGYTNEMRDFLDSNPGLQSRFTNFFNFEDYNPRQMLEIASDIAEKNGYKIDEGGLQLLLDLFTELYENRDQNFGNARTVRNILYKAISCQEERILSLINPTDEDLATLTYEDIKEINVSEF